MVPLITPIYGFQTVALLCAEPHKPALKRAGSDSSATALQQHVSMSATITFPIHFEYCYYYHYHTLTVIYQ